MSDLATGRFYFSNPFGYGEDIETFDGKPYSLPATVLKSEKFIVTSVDYSTSTQGIVIGGETGEVQVLSGVDPNSRRTDLIGASSRINSVKFSGDGLKVVAACENGKVIMWNVPADLFSLFDGQAALTLGGGIGPCNAVAISEDGSLIAHGSHSGHVTVYNSSGTFVSSHEHPSGEINGLVFTTNGENIVFVTNDGATKVIEVDGSLFMTHVSHIHAGEILSIDLIEIEGVDCIVTGGADNQVRFARWDDSPGPVVTSHMLPGHDSPVSGVSWAGSESAYSSDVGRIKRWEYDGGTHFADEGSNIQHIGKSPSKIVAWSPTIAFGFAVKIVSCDETTSNVNIWDVSQGEFSYNLSAEMGDIQVVVWPNPDNFGKPQTRWPNGPLAVNYPVTCYAKKIHYESQMDWEADFKDLTSEDTPIRGYYIPD